MQINVTNTGEVFGEEVVQLYIRDPYASMVRPVMELAGFAFGRPASTIRCLPRIVNRFGCSISYGTEDWGPIDCNLDRIAELECRIKPHGEIGKYLFKQLIQFKDENADGWPRGESSSLGDSTAICLILDDHEFGYEMKPAPRITADIHFIHHQKERMILVYHHVDARYTLEDMYAKVELFTKKR
ncbi:fibronectin type III-like domain-contianing protein [Paenibacillus phytohabitans]|uniref:fibronectin type III-like domain-contianing protein n=1 Tax=Paenibacillus phytohabitans TaxID=2654978 RepID=UPI00300ACBAC